MNFEYESMPVVRPIRIPTKDMGFFAAIWMWLFTNRKWEVMEPWYFKINGTCYVIPVGEIIDGASVPKYFWNWLSPTGILFIPSMVHDYLYTHRNLILREGKTTPDYSRKCADKLFRDIAIEVNGFKIINYLAYFALRPFGWIAWNKFDKKAK